MSDVGCDLIGSPSVSDSFEIVYRMAAAFMVFQIAVNEVAMD